MSRRTWDGGEDKVAAAWNGTPQGWVRASEPGGTGEPGWRNRGRHVTLAPCGKVALDERAAEAKATLLTAPGRKMTAYPCPEGACRAGETWHIRNETKRNRGKTRRATQRKRVNARKTRNRVAEMQPLRQWDDDGGAGIAAWMATGQLRDEQG